MNIQFPSHEEIQAAFKGGEADVVALFDKVGQQLGGCPRIRLRNEQHLTGSEKFKKSWGQI
jgi:hypothetical protein